MAEVETNARVLQRIEITPELMILRVVPDGWKVGDFKAGQFVVLGLPGSAPRHPISDAEDPAAAPDKLIKRAYSVASSPEQREYVEFYISLVRSGALTPRLWALAPGDRLTMGKRFTGLFTLDDVPGEAHVVFLATGTGLAPYMSMLRGFLLHESKRRVAVLHGARHSWDLGYRSELLTLERLFANFAYVPVISEPTEELLEWGGETGFLQDLWRRGLLDELWGSAPTPATTHVFLCGNPLMIENMLPVLGEQGFIEHSRRQPGQIHLEKFW